MSNKPQIIFIFDFDGVICDSFCFAIQAFNVLLAQYNYNEIDAADIERYRNMHSSEFLKDIGISQYKLPFIIRKLRKLSSQDIANMQPIDGIKNAIRQLNGNGIRLGILSSNSKPNITHFLSQHDMHYFEFIYTNSSLFGKHRLLNKVIKKHDFDRNNVYYLGDEVRDVEACHKANVHSMAVTWGYQSKTILEKYNPEYVLEHPSALLSITEELLKL